MGLQTSGRRTIDGLRAHLDSSLPTVLPVGKGTVLCLSGWCYHPMRRIVRLTIRGNDTKQLVKDYGIARPDVFKGQSRTDDPSGHSYSSGFWVIIPFAAGTRGRIDLSIIADLEGGYQAETWLGAVEATEQIENPSWLLPSLRRSTGLRDSTVAICMATHDPDISLFMRQIESLIAQTHDDWICIISDDCSPPEKYFRLREIVSQDTRFYTSRSKQRLGFYRNFERALSLVPARCGFVSLSDQDDQWHAHKLETLLSRFNDESTTLVFSDMNIVGRDGSIISTSFWSNRRNNYE
ncbi:MAG: glycosyltransferase, partial [Gammaproteobacteria bacterium]